MHASKSFLLIIPFFFFACEKDEGDNDPYISLKETIIVYMVADNDLHNVAFDNINEKEEAFTGENKNLLVFMDMGFEESRVIRITHDDTDEIVSPIILAYLNQNSENSDVLQTVIEDILHLYPSLESYCLVLWSQGRGLLPSPEMITKSFGINGTSEMDIKDLEAALPANTFDYIIFDACLMGSIEVAYELRHTPYILASLTEILVTDFPYNNIIDLLFDPKQDIRQRLESVADEYIKYYNAQRGTYKSASITLIQTDALEALAETTRSIINGYPLTKWDYKHDYSQCLDVLEYTLTFDFRDFLYNNYPDATLTAIDQQLSNTVLYKSHTEEFTGISSIYDFCGLSCYISQMQHEELNTYYQALSWCRDSGFGVLF